MIWLLRHGDAEDGDGDDTARRLTGKGTEQARAAGRALANLGVQIDACLTSPKVRARETAGLACEHLGVQPVEREELRGGDLDPSGLAAGLGDVLLVGHEPDFSRAIATATGARVKVAKGGLAAIDGSVLVRLLRPPELRAIAARGR